MPSTPPLRPPPSSGDALERIEAKLDRLERLLAPLSVLSDAPGVAATAVETFDDAARGHEAEIDHRLRAVVQLLERVSRPETLAMLKAGLDMLESLPGMASTAVDALDDAVRPGGFDLHGRVEATLGLLRRATDPMGLRLLDRVLARHRARRTAAEPRLGPLGLWRALREPHTQRALGLLMSLAQSVGEELDDDHQPKSLPA